MSSIVSIDHLEVICNGKPVSTLELHADRKSADAENTIPISSSGWRLLRAFSDKPEYPILDLYPYATTSPIYVEVVGSMPDRKGDAAYFVAWIDRMTEAAKTNHDWNNEAEKSDVLEQMSRARKVYEEIGNVARSAAKP
jgi:TolB protein